MRTEKTSKNHSKLPFLHLSYLQIMRGILPEENQLHIKIPEMKRKERSGNRNEEDARRKLEGYLGVKPQVKESED